MRKMTGGLLFLLAAAISPAQAELVEADYLSYGDGLVTVDTETGLEWLDLTQTYNRAYVDTLEDIKAGGHLEGWRFATEQEVFTLLENTMGITAGARYKPAAYANEGSERYNEAIEFMTMFGESGINGLGLPSSYGQYYSDSSNSIRMAGVRLEHGNVALYRSYLGTFEEDGGVNAGGARSQFLVSTGGLTYSSLTNSNINSPEYWANGGQLYPVSAPALLSLFAFGGLVAARRQRQA